MKRITTFFLITGILAITMSTACAQKASPETAAVQQTVTAFFDGMRRSDSTDVRRTLAPGATDSVASPAQPPKLEIESISGFLKAVGTSHAEVWDERVQFEQVLIAAIWPACRRPTSFILAVSSAATTRFSW